MNIYLPGTPIVWCGIVSAKCLAAHPTFHSRSKRNKVVVHFVHEGQTKVQHISSKVQILDGLTKPLVVFHLMIFANLNLKVEPSLSS